MHIEKEYIKKLKTPYRDCRWALILEKNKKRLAFGYPNYGLAKEAFLEMRDAGSFDHWSIWTNKRPLRVLRNQEILDCL